MILAIVAGILIALLFGRVLLPALAAVVFVAAIPVYFSFRFVCTLIASLIKQKKRRCAMTEERQKPAEPETPPDNVICFDHEREKRIK